jgi:hypothetical protein
MYGSYVKVKAANLLNLNLLYFLAYAQILYQQDYSLHIPNRTATSKHCNTAAGNSEVNWSFGNSGV